MPALPSSNPAQFFQSAPVLHVPDVVAAATFYRDVLGFTWDFGDENYAVVWRDNAAIHFMHADGRPNGMHLFCWVRDVDGYFREIVERNVMCDSEPTDQVYGVREFFIRDLNGIRIVFGQDIEHDRVRLLPVAGRPLFDTECGSRYKQTFCACSQELPA